MKRRTGWMLLAGASCVAALGVVLALPRMHWTRPSSKHMFCLSNLHAIGTAIKARLAETGSLPSSLDELLPDWLPDEQVFICPFSEDPSRSSYLLLRSDLPDPESQPVPLVVCRGKHPLDHRTAGERERLPITPTLFSDFEVRLTLGARQRRGD